MHSGMSKPQSAISGSSLGKVNTSQESEVPTSENPTPAEASGAESASSNLRRSELGRPDSQAKPSPHTSARSTGKDGKHFKPGSTVVL